MGKQKEDILKIIANEIQEYYAVESLGDVDNDYYSLLDILNSNLMFLFDQVADKIDDKNFI